MSYINQIVEDGVTYDIAAKNLVNGYTQTTAGVNALDAAAGKTLYDNKANKVTPTLYFKVGTNDSDPSESNPHIELRNSGNATSGCGLSAVYYDSSNNNTQHTIIDKDGNFCPSLAQGLITTTLTSNVESTVAVSFVQSEARMLFIAHASYANSRGVYIITASAVIPVVEVPNATTLSMANGTLSIKLTTAARIVIV